MQKKSAELDSLDQVQITGTSMHKQSDETPNSRKHQIDVEVSMFKDTPNQAY